MAVCSRCHAEKPPDDFYWKDRAQTRRLSCCKECSKRLQRIQYQQRKATGIATRYRLRRSAAELGLNPDEVEAHYEAHNGLCDICGRTPDMAVQPKQRLSIDHDHLTGAFRGLLCHDCNLLLGLASDSVKRLLAAAEYVESRS